MSFMSDRGARQSAETINNSNSKQMQYKPSDRFTSKKKNKRFLIKPRYESPRIHESPFMI